MVGHCVFCKKQFIKRRSIQLFCSVTCSNRAHRNNKKEVGFPLSYSEELAELFGILLGDGSVTTYYTKVYLNMRLEGAYSLFVQNLFQKLFPGGKTTRHKRKTRGTWEVQISSKEVSDYLKKIGFDPKVRSIPSWILTNQKFTAATIRGLFDTEGSVGIKYSASKNRKVFYKQLTVTNRNKNILHFLEKSLVIRGFKPNKNPTRNIYISNRLDIKRYLADIGSHNPKMLTKLSEEKKGMYEWRGA